MCFQNVESTPHKSQNSNPFKLFHDQIESYVGKERPLHYMTLVFTLRLEYLRFCWQPWGIIIYCDLCTIPLLILLFLMLLLFFSFDVFTTHHCFPRPLKLLVAWWGFTYNSLINSSYLAFAKTVYNIENYQKVSYLL